MGGSSPDRAPGGQLSPLDAALGYAARGWPVFPCNPKNKQPLLAADKDGEGKKIRGTGGVSKATLDADQIRAWWQKWPTALVGLACGHPTSDLGGLRLFVLDFDPRQDPATGEVWTLDRLKRETEEQLGQALPMSMAALTPSGGVHLYLLQADDGPPITNRGNLPKHVDVRGLGGYVIAPPSVMAADADKGQGGKRYGWHRREPIGGIAKAPAALLAILRDRGGKPAQDPAPRPASRSSEPSAPLSADDARGAAIRKYGLACLDLALDKVRTAPSGRRNRQLFNSAFHIASLVAAGALQSTLARSLLEEAAAANPGRDDASALESTIDSGWQAGLAVPHDLSDVGLKAGQGRAGSDRPARPRAAGGGPKEPFRSGSGVGDQPQARGEDRKLVDISEADRVRLQRIAQYWLMKSLDSAEPTPEAFTAIAWGIGRRVAADMLVEADARELLRAAAEDVEGLTQDDVDRAIQDGFGRGFHQAPLLQDLKCAGYPMTDFGIAERFRDRHGHNFRFTTAKGWLGWDGKRWKQLDQDEKTPPAEVIAAAFETVRAIQREARRIRDTGCKWQLLVGVGPKGGKYEYVDDEVDPNPHALDYYIAKGKGFVLFSESLAAFGRGAEVAGKPAAIALLARRWLTVPIEQFDCEQRAINVGNGTLRFNIETMPDGARKVAVILDPHRREDLMTRIAPVDYDRSAPCPLYDNLVAWAQPDDATRRYLHQLGGYSCTGETGEHLLWFHYGRGRNGKSVTIDNWCAALGDYSGTIQVESFLDQGIKKRGDSASPDLAKLGGVRLLRASEPERGAKLNAALVKLATGGEPMSVRALHRGFFDLNPRFKLQMSGNIKPSIPDTDDGIWGRMKLVPWLRHIEKPQEDPFRDRFPRWHEPGAWPAKDTKLGDKIKAAELPGVFRRLIEGLVDYLEHGFVEPDAVTAATADYRDKSDPLARFLRLCTAPDPGGRVKSSDLHAVFGAWCKAAGEKEWTPVGFSNAMEDKGYSKVRSDGMRWEGLKLTRYVHDFIDDQGNVRADLAQDLAADIPLPPAAAGGGSGASFQDDDDDLPRL